MTTPRDLPQLIQQVKDANGWSDEDIAGRARAVGHTISKQHISWLRTKPVQKINAESLRALADGLGVHLVEVVRAALISADLPDVVGDGISAEWAITHDPAVPAHLRRVLLTLLADARTADGRADFALAASDPHASGDGEQRRPRRRTKTKRSGP